jgi:hypothetical protein
MLTKLNLDKRKTILDGFFFATCKTNFPITATKL